MTATTFMERLAGTYGDPSAFSELVFGTPFHKGQRNYAERATADVNFLLPGNSWGKTLFIARKVLYDCWFKVGPERPTNFTDWWGQEYKALVCSYSYPIARESFDRIVTAHRSRDEVKALVKTINASDPARITLTNNAVIDWGSLDGQGKLVEAARRRVIYVDEVGHIPDLAETFDSILYPRTLGVGGRIHLLGTPKPHSDPYLLEIYEKGRSGTDPFYYAQGGSVLENEFWPPEEVERLLANPRYVSGWEPAPEHPDPVSPIRYIGGVPHVPVLTPIGRQVILGHFILAGGFLFDRFHVARMFADPFPPPDWTHGESFAYSPQEGRRYMAAFDLAGNKPRTTRHSGSDPTVGIVIDHTEMPWRIVRFDHLPGGSADWEDKYRLMQQVFETYKLPYLVIDATGNVDSVQEALEARGVPVEGYHFSGSRTRKFDMLRNLQLLMELKWGESKGALRAPAFLSRLRQELERYVLPDDHIQQDCVMALAMVCNEIARYEVPAAYSGEVF